MRGRPPVSYATHSYVICLCHYLTGWMPSLVLIPTSSCRKCESLNGASNDSKLEDFIKLVKNI
jgi:hypothetical protein